MSVHIHISTSKLELSYCTSDTLHVAVACNVLYQATLCVNVSHIQMLVTSSFSFSPSPALSLAYTSTLRGDNTIHSTLLLLTISEVSHMLIKQLRLHNVKSLWTAEGLACQCIFIS